MFIWLCLTISIDHLDELRGKRDKPWLTEPSLKCDVEPWPATQIFGSCKALHSFTNDQRHHAIISCHLYFVIEKPNHLAWLFHDSVMTILTIYYKFHPQFANMSFLRLTWDLSCPTYINSPLSSHVWRIPESTIDRHQKLRWPDSSNLVWNPDPRPKQKNGESGNLEDWEPVFVS